MQYGKIYKRACEYRVVERLAEEIELTAANMIILEYKRDFRRDEAPNIKKKLESTKLPPLTFHMSIPYPNILSWTRTVTCIKERKYPQRSQCGEPHMMN